MCNINILSVEECHDEDYGASIIQYKANNGDVSFVFSSLTVEEILARPEAVSAEIEQKKGTQPLPLWSDLSDRMLELITDSSFDMFFIDNDDENWTEEMADAIWDESISHGLNSVVTAGEDGGLITVYAGAIGSVNWAGHPVLGSPCFERRPSPEHELLQERLDALRAVKVYGEPQSQVVQFIAAALEAHASGPEAYNAFVEEQTKDGVPWNDISIKLWRFHPEQSPEAESIIEYAKQIVKRDEYVRVLECSERGDKRFTPQHATLNILGQERNIEEIYRTAKRAKDGSCAAAGEKPDHIIDPFTGDKFPGNEAPWFYRGLWISYLTNNPELVKYAEQFDAFSNIGSRHNLENSYHVCIEAFVKGDRQRYVDVVKSSDWYKNMARKLKRPLADQIADAGARSGQTADKTERTGHEGPGGR